MSRKLTSHIVNPANDKIEIEVADEPGPGGAPHAYSLRWPIGEEGDNIRVQFHLIEFQNGPIAEAGINGLTHEALLAILIDRLECFQRGPFACEENASTLLHLRAAQVTLLSRTKNRMARGVEGTNQV